MAGKHGGAVNAVVAQERRRRRGHAGLEHRPAIAGDSSRQPSSGWRTRPGRRRQGWSGSPSLEPVPLALPRVGRQARRTGRRRSSRRPSRRRRRRRRARPGPRASSSRRPAPPEAEQRGAGLAALRGAATTARTEHRVRADLDEARRSLAAASRLHRVGEAHRLAHVAGPVGGVELGRRRSSPVTVETKRARGPRRGEPGEHPLEGVGVGRHLGAVERVVDRQRTHRRRPVARSASTASVHRGVVARDHRRRRRVDGGDGQRPASARRRSPRRRPRAPARRRPSRPAGGRLHQPAAVGDDAARRRPG